MNIDILGYNVQSRKDDATFAMRNSGGAPINIGVLATDDLLTAFGLTKAPIADRDSAIDYQILINDKQMSPKKIRAIRIFSDKPNQLRKPLTWIRAEANGNYLQVVDQVANLISPMQYQSILIDVPYENLVVGQDTFFTYELLPFTNVQFTFLYEEFRLEDLLRENFLKENNRPLGRKMITK